MASIAKFARASKLALLVTGTVVLLTGLDASISQAQSLDKTSKPGVVNRFQVTTRSLSVPLHLDRNVIPKLKEVCLCVKEGAEDWKCLARVPPTSTVINCDLPRDGEFTLVIVTVDHKGKTSPADLTKAAPYMVVVVDTRQNTPDITATEPAKFINLVSFDAGMPQAREPQAIIGSARENLVPPSNMSSNLPSNLPRRQYLNSSRVGLDYTINKVGPSGVSKIDVYVTTDQVGGWKKLITIDDPANHHDVDLPGEGVFGIRLVATNGNGFGGKVPGPTDLPTAVFEIDMTGPVLKVEVDPVTKLGTMDIRWQASDKNLATEPIRILYAAQPGGPWQTAAAALKNDGVYHWTLPRDISPNFVVRFEARDLAGNVSRVDTANPVPLDMSEPDVSLVGLTPVAIRPASVGSAR